MSWAYFTAYLDGTRPITKAERDELADQLAAKLTFPCGRFGLDATRQTAIRASLLATDLIGVRDGVSTFAQGLYTAITSTYAVAFGGSSAVLAAQATALAAEGITDTQLAAIRTSAADHFRLWNFYKRFIDALVPTADPLGTVLKRSVSASKTKCGFAEWSGYESSPPKIYQRIDFSGTITFREWSGAACSGTCVSLSESIHSGYCTIDRGTCVYGVEAGSKRFKGYSDCGTTLVVDDTTGACGFWEDYPDVDFSSTVSSTVRTKTGLACEVTGSYTETISNEFTTAILSTDVDAALPAFSGSFLTTGSSSALYDLSTDELTITKRALQYKLPLPSLAALGYSTYYVQWIERFTPAGGGSPVDTVKSYTWDGSATETPVYTINPPSTPGSTAILAGSFSYGC